MHSCVNEMNTRLPVLLAGLLVALNPMSAEAWGGAHPVMTSAAWEVQDEAFKELWKEKHHNARVDRDETLAWYLVNHFCKHPDWVDGPTRDETDIPERLRIAKYLYAEREGKYFPPIAYTDPDKATKGPRPRTYHYFTLQTDELNRAFALKGARWYFEKISTALREGRNADAAEYVGAFAHAMQDRVSPYHVWDGYTEDREAFEDEYRDGIMQKDETSFRGKSAGASMFWALGGEGLSADLGDYQPKSLGATPEGAAGAFTERLFASREFALKVYIDPDAYLGAHWNDNWVEKKVSPETNRHLETICHENAKLLADVLQTVWTLSQTE